MGAAQDQQFLRECFERWRAGKEADAELLALEEKAQEKKARILSRYQSPQLCNAIERNYSEVKKEDGELAALEWLQKLERKFLQLNIPLVNVCSHDQAVKDAAETMAKKCEREILAELRGVEKQQGKKAARERALFLVNTICQGAEVDPPEIPKSKREDKQAVAAAVLRLCSAKWWRGQLRKLQGRKLEGAARDLGMVHKRAGGYCSSLAVSRRRAQNRRNRKMLESFLAVNDEREEFSLAELSDLGLANPVNRRNELMARMRGCQEWAEQHQDENGRARFQCEFWTATCPSRFHAFNKGGKRYKNWDGSDPRKAQAWLNERWRLLRALYQERGIRFYGLRTVEPHHDGCPHWHLLLWFDRRQAKLARVLFQEVWRGVVRPRIFADASTGYRWAVRPGTGLCNLKFDGGQPGAAERRTNLKTLTGTGSKGAAAYVAKYVSKNIDGMATVKTAGGEIQEAWSRSSVREAERIGTWAALWGIRQFQAIGQPSVTVWRELRRLGEGEKGQERVELLADYLRGDGSEPVRVDLEALELARQGADQGEWKLFLQAMGGPMVPRSEQPLRPMYREREEVNEYGEAVERIRGILLGGEEIVTRTRNWIVRPGRKAQNDADVGAAGLRSPPGIAERLAAKEAAQTLRRAA